MKKMLLNKGVKFVDLAQRIKITSPKCPNCGEKWFYILFINVGVAWDIFEHIDHILVDTIDEPPDSMLHCNSCNHEWKGIEIIEPREEIRENYAKV